MFTVKQKAPQTRKTNSQVRCPTESRFYPQFQLQNSKGKLYAPSESKQIQPWKHSSWNYPALTSPGLEEQLGCKKQAWQGRFYPLHLPISEFLSCSVHLRLTLLSVLLTKDSPVDPTVSQALKLEVTRKLNAHLDEAWVAEKVRRPLHQRLREHWFTIILRKKEH